MHMDCILSSQSTVWVQFYYRELGQIRDLTSWGRIYWLETAEEMQHILEVLNQFCNLNKLTVNTRKTSVIVLKKKAGETCEISGFISGTRK